MTSRSRATRPVTRRGTCSATPDGGTSDGLQDHLGRFPLRHRANRRGAERARRVRAAIGGEARTRGLAPYDTGRLHAGAARASRVEGGRSMTSGYTSPVAREIRRAIAVLDDNLVRARLQRRADPNWVSGNGEPNNDLIAGYERERPALIGEDLLVGIAVRH